jgi:two-component system nitrogen regulation response regulator GlnG
MSRVLVVDDEESICWALERVLSDDGHEVYSAATAEDALRCARQAPPDVIFLDVRLPGRDGLSAMEDLRATSDSASVVVMTAFGDLDTAVRAMSQGATDYLTKPFDPDVALAAVQQATRKRPAAMPEHTVAAPGGFVGASPAMQDVYKRIALAAPTEAPVLISGESGSGKELVAAALHRHSSRADRPFIPVNLAALSEGVAESELFGHLRGAFTGAVESRRGLLESAHGGTLFLDEVSEVPLPLQVKLLRALELGQFTPVGGTSERTINVRLISATNRDLRSAVREGTFREDLYYRLAGFEIAIPALRDRGEDIALLARHFLESEWRGADRPLISQDAIDALRKRQWNGNVRELRHAVLHAAILARGGVIGEEHLPPPLELVRTSGASHTQRVQESLVAWTDETLGREPQMTDLYERLMQLVEPPVLNRTLARHNGNRLESARTLGLHRMTLRKKLRGPDDPTSP